jgi:hypothetical protein
MRSSWIVVTLAVAVVGILTLPGIWVGAGGFSRPSAIGTFGSSPTINAYLSLGNGSGSFTSPLLLGTTVTPRAPLLPGEATAVSATSGGAVIWPGGNAGDDLNPLGDNGSGVLYTATDWGHFVLPETNESDFVNWCRSINCTAIFQLPGEINNPSIAADIVAYTVNKSYSGPMWRNETQVNGKGQGNALGSEYNVTNVSGLDFRPAYWEIGNEPVFWHHYNQPWGVTSQTGNVTPAQYGQIVASYQLAIDRANTSYTPRIVAPPGLGDGANPVPWIDDLLNDTGGNLAGIGMHVYASGNGNPGNTENSSPSLAQFESSFTPAAGLYSNIIEEESDINTACHSFGRNCTLPMFVTEVGTSLSHGGYGTFSVTFPGALDVAIMAIQAMDFSASTIVTTNVFSTVSDSNNSWFNLSGAVRPAFTTFSQILNHLGNDAFPVKAREVVNGVVTGKTLPTVTALATIAPNSSDRHDFLVVNVNVNGSATFNTSFLNSSYVSPTSPAYRATFKNGAPVEVWEWSGKNATVFATSRFDDHPVLYNTSDPATPAPVATYYPNGLPTNFSVPEMGLALFESYNKAAYPVQFEEVGLPGNLTNYSAHWSLDVNGSNTSTNTTNITLLLPPGTYPTSGVIVPIPTPGSALAPKERYVPILPATTVVGNSPQTVPVTYIRQWALNISWDRNRGTVVATDFGNDSAIPPTWWNDSKPLTLQFEPKPGYALETWAGEGPGSYHNYTVTATLVPTGPLEEQALFVPGFGVTFSETGLPAGTPWNVSLRGLNATTTNSSDTLYEINGQWPFQLNDVRVRNLSTGNLTVFRPQGGARDVSVQNHSVNVPVTFVELYPITFTESGLPTGTNWSVLVGNDTVQTEGTSNGTSIIVQEADSETNRSWGYLVPYVYPAGSHGYRPVRTEWNGTQASGPNGNVTVDGSGVTVRITFIELTPNATRYPIYFTESNLTPETNWSVTVAAGSNLSSTNWSTTPVNVVWEPDSPLGGWGYSASAPGYRFNGTVYRTVPSVTVDNASAFVPVSFNFLYSVTFVESNLPLPFDPPVGWNVTLAPGNATSPQGGAHEVNASSTGPSITVQETNGTWGYIASAGPEWRFVRTLPYVHIKGEDVVVEVPFNNLTEATFEETGLLPGTPWDLEVHGFLGPVWNNNTSPLKNFFEVHGDWGYTIGNVSTRNSSGTLTKYHVIRTEWNGTQAAGPSGNFTVNQSAVTIQVTFEPIPYYPVTFSEVGLPSDWSWSVTIRNLTQSSLDSGAIVFPEQDGLYAFGAGAPGGYAITSALHFNLTGDSLSVTVAFVPKNNVTWEESGLGPNLTWSVVLNGTRDLSAHGGWTNVRLFNGTGYTFDIPVVQGYPGGPAYVPVPRMGTFDLTGGGLIVDVQFVLVTYQVTLVVSGLPVGDLLRAQLSSTNETTPLRSVELALPNGTWSFDVIPPTGYYGSPEGGKVDVSGHDVIVTIAILPIGRGPTPPFWTLVVPAATTAGAIGLAGAGMFALLGVIRRRRGGAPL